MIKSGRLFKHNVAQANASVKWHGYIAHLLELVTGKAFKDYPTSQGAMKVARELVAFFSTHLKLRQFCLESKLQVGL